MRGQILNYDAMTATGIISCEAGNRYGFAGTSWRGSPQQLRAGSKVDFDSSGSDALEIYPLPGSSGLEAITGPDKNPVVAGLLAFFLGSLGIHKFYLGYNAQGATLLIGTVISWLLLIVIIGFFGLMAIGIICLAETIIYITKSPEEFQRIYVDGHKPWF